LLSRGGDDDSGVPAIDADGGRVAFASRADNLVPGDHNGHGEVLVWDRASNSIRRAGLDAAGSELPGGSGVPSISADGTRVAFVLAGTRGGGCDDAYVKDLGTGALTLASVATDSIGGCGHVEDVALSGDGRRVGFSTSWPISPEDHDFTLDVYVRDLVKGTTTLVSGRKLPGIVEERGLSYGPSLSSDGRWVVFTSFADDMGAGSVRHANSVYLKDLTTGTLQMIAARPGRPAPNGSSQGVVLSPDGAHVAFTAAARNLVPADNNHAVDLFVLDRSGPRYPPATTRPTAPVVPPHTTIDVGPLGTVAAGEQRFVLLADTDPVRFQCKFDSGNWHWCAAEVRWRVRPGAHTLWARAVDSAGNVDQAPAGRVFRAR
jgi:Tol biopolymer transport system component